MGTIGIFVILFLTFSCGQAKVQRSVSEFFKREKCMPDLGCFYAGSPFFDIVERPISLLPDDRYDILTTFLLFTPFRGEKYTAFTNFNFSKEILLEGGFDPNLKTKFVIPGFMSHLAPYWKMPMVHALLQAENCNVFLVDWQNGDGPIYEQAVANTRVVGAEIAFLINQLQAKFGLQLNSTHLIGHSLGAHIAGYAGKQLNKLGRITAMDPAGPYFTSVDPIVRLDKSDALFVDAIHTNAAPSRFQGFGLTESIAHLDFWPNGGHVQPGCPFMGHSILSFFSHPTLDYDGLHDIMCNHDRAIKLFHSSIINQECKLFGSVCESLEEFENGKCSKCEGDGTEDCFLLGLQADQYAHRIQKDKSINIFMQTTEREPFCIR